VRKVARDASRSKDPFGRGDRPGPRWGELRAAPVFVLVLAPTLAFAQSSLPSGEFKVRTDVELVLLDVSVKHSKGGYVSGLGKENFQIFENGAPQKITEFSSADVPVAIGLVMDDSGSMQFKRREVITAGLIFIGASNPRDQMFVVNFNDNVRRGLPESVPFTDDLRLLRAALAQDAPQGRTALYDAVAFALKHLESGRRDKKTLVIVSDGGDNISRHTLKEVMLLIQESRATIYTVGIFASDDPDRNPRVLERIAKISGGESFFPHGLDEVVPICRQIANDIRHRYTVGYIPVHGGNKTALRKIHIVARAADRGKLVVRTRTSYWLPAPVIYAPEPPERLK
jgi:Ca-activated chloride channel family protein